MKALIHTAASVCTADRAECSSLNHGRIVGYDTDMQLVDSHCHIDGPEYDDDRPDVIVRAREAGVTAMLNVGTGDPRSGAFERAAALAAQSEAIFAAIGVHPHDAKLYDDHAEQRLMNLPPQNDRGV